MCVKHCPFTFAKIVDDRVKGICIRCGKCVKVCPVNARVDIFRSIKQPVDYALLLEVATPERLQAIIDGKPIEVKVEATK